MPEQPSHRLPEEFGGNEWLVDELYERYQQDKNSVDAKWWPLFESFDTADGTSSNGTSAAPANPPTREIPVVAQAAATAMTPVAPVVAPAAPPPPRTCSGCSAAPVKKAPATVAKDGAQKPSDGSQSQPIPAQLPKSTKAPPRRKRTSSPSSVVRPRPLRPTWS
ncbi:2-Oxoglutarate dehydrogenase E1 component [Arthrobacter sp. Hiyo8]|nr:2-Oxoglutarate dehydrogenase E1 component [Arthrobacter sp. Hiyo8]